MHADIIRPRPARCSQTDAVLSALIEDVILGNGILAEMRLRAAFAKLDVTEARALYLRLADANDPIAQTFARLPQRAEWRDVLRSRPRHGSVTYIHA